MGPASDRGMLRIRSRDNEVTTLWIPAHSGIEGSEEADGLAEVTVDGQTADVPDEVRWEVSLLHPSHRAAVAPTANSLRMQARLRLRPCSYARPATVLITLWCLVETP